MLGTGVRVGEACALTWERIDLEAGTLRVEATYVDGPSDKRGVQQALKTDRSRRTLFLPDFVVVSLVEHGPREAGPVLVTRTGACMSPANLRRSLCAVVAEANLDFRVTSHTLRRTLATFLAREIGTREAADQLGHTDPVVALSHYIAPEHRGRTPGLPSATSSRAPRPGAGWDKSDHKVTTSGEVKSRAGEVST